MPPGHLRFSICFALAAMFACMPSAHTQAWKAFADSGKIQLSSKRYGAAIENLVKAESLLPHDSSGSVTRADLLINLGDCFIRTRDLKKADSVYPIAGIILLSSFGAGSLQYSTVLEKTSLLELEKQHFPMALAYMHEAKRIRIEQLPLVSASVFRATNTLGLIHTRTGTYDSAVFYFSEARAISEKLYGIKSNEYISTCNNLGNSYTNLSRYSKALELLHAAWQARRDNLPSDSLEYARSCNNLSDACRRTGAFEQAESFGLEALALRKKLLGENDPVYAISCNNMGNVYRDMGNFEKSEQMYLEAKAIREKNPGKNNMLYASTCTVLADLYYKEGRNETAAQLYLESMDIISRISGNTSMAYAEPCQALANLYRLEKQYEKSELYFRRARDIWDAELDEQDVNNAQIRDNIGLLYLETGKYDLAESNFLAARKIWAAAVGEAHISYTENTRNLAGLYRLMGKEENAFKLYREAMVAEYGQINRIFRFTSSIEKQQYLDRVSGSAAEVYSFILSAKSRAYDSAAYDLSLHQRNMVLGSEKRVVELMNTMADPAMKDRYATWLNKKKQLGQLYREKDGIADDEIRMAEDTVQSLEKELSKASATFSSLGKEGSTGWREIQAKLGKGQAAIEFISFPYFNGIDWTDSIFYCALVLRKEYNSPKLILLFEQGQLTPYLKNLSPAGINELYRGGIVVGSNGSAGFGRQLGNLLWSPLQYELKGIRQITYAPSGDLYRISLAALSTGEGLYMCDKFTLTQVSTTAAVGMSDEYHITGKGKVVVYGGIQYDKDSSGSTTGMPLASRTNAGTVYFNYLDNTGEEASAISRLATVKGSESILYSGYRATETSFKSYSGNDAADIMHIASHGFFFPDPFDSSRSNSAATHSVNFFLRAKDPLFRSGLVFAGGNPGFNGTSQSGDDGILTAYEISQMYMSRTRLVVLSACETALGDIHGSEGVFGLQRAFRIAGVKYLLMSLWKVPDAETRDFMIDFYTNLFNSKDIESSFLATQKKMRKRYPAETFKWGAWVLVKG